MVRHRFALVVAWLAPLLSVLFAPALAADSVEIVADRDSTLYEDSSGTVSNGAGSRFFSGLTLQADTNNGRRALLHFDVEGALPAGSSVTSATLTLHLSRTNDFEARVIALNPLLADWGEGTSNADPNEGSGTAATAGDAT